MHAESVRKFEALETLASDLRARYVAAGYEPVAPAILQPADIFLDTLGEQLRSRSYVFTDLDGHELCLRPDLTVPAARLYLERNPQVYEVARYCYNGPAFRYTVAGSKKAQPGEFRQAGFELYAYGDAELAETEILKLALDGIEAAGLHNYNITIGDLSLFTAFLAAIPMPERWRQRLRHHFWRPATFHKLLHTLAEEPDEGDKKVRNWPKLDPEAPDEAEDKVAAYLEERGIPLIGARSLGEITERLMEYQADAQEPPLPREMAQLIEDYLAIVGPPRAAMARLSDLADSAGIKMKTEIRRFERRLELFKDRDIELKNVEFSAEFGRNLEYYTGFVFQIEAVDEPDLGTIAGGGRYDRLLQNLGANKPVPAVGCAIHTERLLAAVDGGLA